MDEQEKPTTEVIVQTEKEAVVENASESSEKTVAEVVKAIGEDERSALIEALLFASGEPLSVERIAEVAEISTDEVEVSIQELTALYSEQGHGFEIVRVASMYQLRTRACFAPLIRRMRADRPRRLSNAALETLAIVAYRQPVVKSDVEKIRAVDVTPTLKTLLERGLVSIVGHQASVGQPALYGTTVEFLKLFGLNSLDELPTLRDIKEFERDPGERADERDETSMEAGNDEGRSVRTAVDDDGQRGRLAVDAG